MQKVIVDLQFSKNNEFTLTELAVYDGVRVAHYIFKMLKSLFQNEAK